MRQKRLAQALALSWFVPLLLWSYQAGAQYDVQTYKEKFAGDGPIPFINYNGATFSYFDRDKQGNIYFADYYSGVIAKRDYATGEVTQVTTVSQCAALAIDSADNIYVGKNVNVFKVSGNPAVLTNVAGNGTGATSGDGGLATAAGINIAFDVAVDKSRNRMYILQQVGRIRQVDLATGIITTVVGGATNSGFTYTGDGGPATAATLGRRQRGITTDSAGNIYFASEFGVNFPNYRILKVTLATGVITSIAGNGTSGFSGDGGPATAASIGGIAGITVDNAGNVFFIDGDRIRKIDAGGTITTIAGTGTEGSTGDGGPATAAQIAVSVNGLFGDLILDATNTYLYLSQNVIPRFRRIHLASGIISEVNTLPPGIAANGDGGKAVDVFSAPEQFEGVTGHVIGYRRFRVHIGTCHRPDQESEPSHQYYYDGLRQHARLQR